MHLPLIFNQVINASPNANPSENHPARFKKKVISLINPNENDHTQKKIIALNQKLKHL